MRSDKVHSTDVPKHVESTNGGSAHDSFPIRHQLDSGASPSIAGAEPVPSDLFSRAKSLLREQLQTVRKRARIRSRLKMAWVRRHVHQIRTSEALKLIDSRNLKTVNGSWHFSWDIERFFDRMLFCENRYYTYVFHTEPLNQWAPAPLFTDDPRVDFLIAQVGKNCPFWLLKLTSFDDFLARRSAISSQPTKHFPTRQTYLRYARKIDCGLVRLPLCENAELFCKHYNQWKQSKYGHTGEHILAEYFNNHPRVPKEWLFIHALREKTEDAYKGMCFVIEDGRSCCLFNIASEGGHGRFLLVESIKQCCSKGYSTYDCGVTGMYGTYKSMIFLDRIETDDTGLPSFLPGSPPSFLIKDIAKRRSLRT